AREDDRLVPRAARSGGPPIEATLGARPELRSRPIIALALAVGAVVGLLPPVYGLAVVGGALLFTVGLVRPLWPLYLLGLAAPLGSVREIRLGGVGLSPTEGLVAAALIAYGLVLLSRREAHSRLSAWSAPMALFLLIGILSTGWAASASDAAKELLRWVELAGAFG